MRVTTKILATAGTIAMLLGLNYLFEHGLGDFRFNAYYARILYLIGINITLAVSLNLINGLAGQFSIGHAGFMAVGGYSATFVTVYYGRAIAGLVGSTLDEPVGAAVVMIGDMNKERLTHAKKVGFEPVDLTAHDRLAELVADVIG